MARIIPWKLPDVQGGSIGGYTPAPTPEPVSNDPYDLDDFNIDVEIKMNSGTYAGNNTAYGIYGLVTVSGAKILDVSDVSSVKATIAYTGGTVEVTGNNGSTATIYPTDDATLEVEIGQIMTMIGGTADIAPKILTTPYPNVKVMFDKSSGYAYGITSYAFYPATMTTCNATVEVTQVTVYNSGGVAMQVWEPEE